MQHSMGRQAAAMLAATLIGAALAVATPASAQAPAGQPQGDRWNWAFTLYGWFPSIGGTTNFPLDTQGQSISVSAEDIISHLQFVFSGALDANNGTWGVFNDLIYLDLDGDKSNLSVGGRGLPPSATADASVNFKSTIWTVAGEYRLASDPAATADLLFGARMLSLKQKLDYTLYGANLPVTRSGSSEVSPTNWDAVVGVKGRFAFGANREWVVPYYFDVGTGNSDLTWQAAVGIGYQFKWGDIIAMYRYLDYNMKSGEPIQSLDLGGPLVGVTFRW